jgi:hypothetical protein
MERDPYEEVVDEHGNIVKKSTILYMAMSFLRGGKSVHSDGRCVITMTALHNGIQKKHILTVVT